MFRCDPLSWWWASPPGSRRVTGWSRYLSFMKHEIKLYFLSSTWATRPRHKRGNCWITGTSTDSVSRCNSEILLVVGASTLQFDCCCCYLESADTLGVAMMAKKPNETCPILFSHCNVWPGWLAELNPHLSEATSLKVLVRRPSAAGNNIFWEFTLNVLQSKYLGIFFCVPSVAI